MNFISYIFGRSSLFLLANSGETSADSLNWSLLSTIGQFFYLAAIFLFIVLMAVYTLRFASRFRNYSGGNNNLRVIETRSLGSHNFVHLVKVGNKFVMVGSSKENVSFLGEVDKEGITDTFGSNETPGFERQLSAQIKKLLRKDMPPEE